jgi:hypothetical protein
MTINEIHADLLKQVRKYYERADIIHLDVPQEEVEIQFNLSDEDRRDILVFMEDNPMAFKDRTKETRRDVLEMEYVGIRFDTEGIYFGKSGYDDTATTASAYYLLNVYLDEFAERIGDILKSYKKDYQMN